MKTNNALELLNLSQLQDKLSNLIKDYHVEKITTNSKQVDSKTVFVALKGHTVNARKFVRDAVANGCRVVITYLEDELVNSLNLVTESVNTTLDEKSQQQLYPNSAIASTDQSLQAEFALFNEANILVQTSSDLTILNTTDVDLNDVVLQQDVVVIKVRNLEKLLNLIALNFYDQVYAQLGKVSSTGNKYLDIPVIGITGTNGKTMSANLICQALQHYQQQVHYIGTIGLGAFNKLEKATNTTPDACTVAERVYQAQQDGASALVMEVSSHGLALNRAKAIRYQQAIFTNLTQDHLDFHKTLADYFAAKVKFFVDHNVRDFIITCDQSDAIDYGDKLVELLATRLGGDYQARQQLHAGANTTIAQLTPDSRVARYVNKYRDNVEFYRLEVEDFKEQATEDDALVLASMEEVLKILESYQPSDFQYFYDRNYQDLPQQRIAVISLTPSMQVLTYNSADLVVALQSIKATPKGLQLSFVLEDKNTGLYRECEVQSPLYGTFNGYNLLTAFTSLYLYGCPVDFILDVLPKLTSVAGRMQVVPNQLNKTFLVDFAHTPDALEKAIISAKAHFSDPASKVWVVFGCGGDRDATKRPIMGRIAAQLADYVVVTDDNSRSEDPFVIGEQVLHGCNQVGSSAVCEYIHDRRKAIAHVVAQSKPGDLILVCGKGHETEQIFADRVEHFSDFEELVTAIATIRL